MLKVDLWKTMKRMVAMQPDFRGFATHLPLGTPAPDFLLRDAAGQEQRLSALRGKVVVLEPQAPPPPPPEEEAAE